VKRAQSFLDSWQSGPDHYAGAASQTNAPNDAQTALAGYGTGLGLTSVAFSAVTASPTPGAAASPGTASPGAASQDTTSATASTTVSFTVTAQVKGGTWSYPGSLKVQQTVGGSTSVVWSPSVLFPALKDGQTLTAGPIPASASTVTVTDAKGVALTAAKYPSLAEIINTIAQHGASGAGGAAAESGSGVELVDSSQQPVSTAKVFTAPKAAKIVTTLDAHLQAVAETAVRNSGKLKGLPASVVALDHSNGHILAIAYANTGGDGNTAINAAQPPGSTMKIITAATLFDHGQMTPTSPAPCTPDATVYGQTFHNDNNEARADTTLTSAFAMSCNTSFIKAGFQKLVNNGDASLLSKEAANVFGLGDWSIGGGVQTTNPSVPGDPQGGDQGAQFIGQGKVVMSPLVLASLAATVRHGGFEQPIIMPGQPQTPAAEPISGSTAANLRTLMHAAAHDSDGTATPRLGGLAGTGAKTGTAEVGSKGTDGWFTAYDGRIAAASLVIGGSTGVDSAGYVVQALLEND
jgi:hypothetical protein